MGMIIFDLILPALLYNNPNLTKEEFAKKSFDYNTRNHDFTFDLDLELEKIANNFYIPYSEKYLEFHKTKKDENNIQLKRPYFNKEDAIINIHTKNNLLPKKEITITEKRPIEEGSIVYLNNMTRKEGIITKIKSISDIIDIEDNRNITATVQPIQREEEIFRFDSLNELYKEFPFFEINNKYNWNKKSGNIYAKSEFEEVNTNKFFWKQEKGKYSMDEKTFNLLHTSSSYTYDEKYQQKYNCKAGEAGYLDLILTAEFIRRNKQGKFPLHIGAYVENFLKNHPSSLGIYDKAVKDVFYSHYAKDKEMSINDMLRMRSLWGK